LDVGIGSCSKEKVAERVHPYPPRNGKEPRQVPIVNQQSYVKRKETKSQILEDYDLINQRKGFQRSYGSESRLVLVGQTTVKIVTNKVRISLEAIIAVEAFGRRLINVDY
jgi:hypothetical protein